MRSSLSFLVALLLVALASVSDAAAQESATEVSTSETPALGAVDLGREELEVWLRLDELARLFVLEVEAVGDGLSRSSRPERRRAALKLQTSSAAAMLAATSHPDATLAFLDSWTLVRQFERYFRGEYAAARFGRDAERLAEACERLDESYVGASRSFLDEKQATEARTLVIDWADSHAIEAESFLRRSLIATLAADLAARPTGPLAVTRRMSRTAEALESRLGLYAEVVPRLLRWQAELALEAPEVRDLIAESVATLASIRELLGERDSEEDRLLDELEERIDRQRVAALAEARQVSEEVAASAVDRAMDRVWVLSLRLGGLAFLAACILVWLHARLRRS